MPPPRNSSLRNSGVRPSRLRCAKPSPLRTRSGAGYSIRAARHTSRATIAFISSTASAAETRLPPDCSTGCSRGSTRSTRWISQPPRAASSRPSSRTLTSPLRTKSSWSPPVKQPDVSGDEPAERGVHRFPSTARGFARGALHAALGQRNPDRQDQFAALWHCNGV
ncbi:hypothetical protein SDC9_207934 [bioreactor metagenome]|uniref:Uncharacterized protein n=1 Tax=bioreactor metagenome TaxID=1076179 RepID=A0A645JBT3_9ZZZZ